MSWKAQCLSTMDTEDLFEDTEHRNRFKELFDCYSAYPFFTKGLCKCMYLSAWDMEHFYAMLEVLSTLVLGHAKDTAEVRARARQLASEQPSDEAYIYLISDAFLDDEPFTLDDTEGINTTTLYLIGRALYMSSVIDSL